jgi:hypothetical protein
MLTTIILRRGGFRWGHYFGRDDAWMWSGVGAMVGGRSVVGGRGANIR